MFDIYIDVNDNSPISENESMTAFIFMPEIDIKNYESDPAQFRKLLKQRMENTLNG